VSRWLVCFALALAACWRGGGASETEVEEPAPKPRVKGATCAEVARNAHAVVERAEDKELAARADPLGELVERRCDADAWSMELRRCVASAKTVDEASACDKLSTQAQRDAFAQDFELMFVRDDAP
jgi:hypothetical protein